MNIIQLQYLVDVAELGTFTEAAKKNLMTVPAISISISQLEEELEVSLFTRSRKGVTPTNEGKKVIQYAISILKTIDKMKNDISISRNTNQGSISIATIPGIVPKIINTTLDYQKRYPYINVQIVEGDTATVLNHVKNGVVDMGFVTFSTTNHDSAISWQPIIKDEAILVVSKSSAFRFHQSISSNEIKDETIVLYNDPYIKLIAEKFLLDDQSSNKVSLISNNVDAIFQMVVKANAITIATDYIVNSLPSHIKDEVITISINEYAIQSNFLWRLTRQNEKVSTILEQFTEHLLSQLT
ncbi:LysR family transcriptional regulator [Ureibacillus aquaedulcis]|uniref:LysR family transcriptional regulator n=1 Tax=Ureibacillus aquaedulcis TaxID=3058421 RepID=A0ABT8GN19_9BACL|nr:LysR family transcriptional regulator [Ureibacillus sp. BA0131]MDN4492805.1 LysR family transcriptional regulator [Ureibacillus sp. BA0131]